MRRNANRIAVSNVVLHAIIFAALLASCATTPKAQIVQQAVAVEAANDLLVTALTYEIITIEQAKEGQKLTRLAATNIKAAATALRAGAPQTEVDRLMSLALNYLIQANAIANGGT